MKNIGNCGILFVYKNAEVALKLISSSSLALLLNQACIELKSNFLEYFVYLKACRQGGAKDISVNKNMHQTEIKSILISVRTGEIKRLSLI